MTDASTADVPIDPDATTSESANGSSDAAHDSQTSGGTPSEMASAAGSPGEGTVDGKGDADLIDGVLSPGSSATGGSTEPADPSR